MQSEKSRDWVEAGQARAGIMKWTDEQIAFAQAMRKQKATYKFIVQTVKEKWGPEAELSAAACARALKSLAAKKRPKRKPKAAGKAASVSSKVADVIDHGVAGFEKLRDVMLDLSWISHKESNLQDLHRFATLAMKLQHTIVESQTTKAASGMVSEQRTIVMAAIEAAEEAERAEAEAAAQSESHDNDPN
jgi:hypothetical protein